MIVISRLIGAKVCPSRLISAPILIVFTLLFCNAFIKLSASFTVFSVLALAANTTDFVLLAGIVCCLFSASFVLLLAWSDLCLSPTCSFGLLLLCSELLFFNSLLVSFIARGVSFAVSTSKLAKLALLLPLEVSAPPPHLDFQLALSRSCQLVLHSAYPYFDLFLL